MTIQTGSDGTLYTDCPYNHNLGVTCESCSNAELSAAYQEFSAKQADFWGKLWKMNISLWLLILWYLLMDSRPTIWLDYISIKLKTTTI